MMQVWNRMTLLY